MKIIETLPPHSHPRTSVNAWNPGRSAIKRKHSSVHRHTSGASCQFWRRHLSWCDTHRDQYFIKLHPTIESYKYIKHKYIVSKHVETISNLTWNSFEKIAPKHLLFGSSEAVMIHQPSDCTCCLVGVPLFKRLSENCAKSPWCVAGAVARNEQNIAKQWIQWMDGWKRGHLKKTKTNISQVS